MLQTELTDIPNTVAEQDQNLKHSFSFLMTEWSKWLDEPETSQRIKSLIPMRASKIQMLIEHMNENQLRDLATKLLGFQDGPDMSADSILTYLGTDKTPREWYADPSDAVAGALVDREWRKKKADSNKRLKNGNFTLSESDCRALTLILQEKLTDN